MEGPRDTRASWRRYGMSDYRTQRTPLVIMHDTVHHVSIRCRIVLQHQAALKRIITTSEFTFSPNSVVPRCEFAARIAWSKMVLGNEALKKCARPDPVSA